LAEPEDYPHGMILLRHFVLSSYESNTYRHGWAYDEFGIHVFMLWRLESPVLCCAAVMSEALTLGQKAQH